MLNERFAPPEENFAGGLRDVEIPELGEGRSGKVSKIWEIPRSSLMVIVRTDRVSVFDNVVGAVPGKGAVLNKLSAFWGGKTGDILPDHVIAVPHPNVLIAHKTTPLPVEVVVRGFLTRSSTDTSPWGRYSKGEREMYGLTFPEGLRANERYPEAIVTPTTKAVGGEHDKPLTDEEARGLVDDKFGTGIWDKARTAALAVFARGQQLSLERGFILVDTKYEFGEIDGDIVFIDEMNTPDSSRFWRANTYEERFAASDDPDSFDKEALRRWCAQRGYRGEGKIPVIDRHEIDSMAKAYQELYESLTGETLPDVLSDATTIRAAVLDSLRGMGL